MEKILVQSSFNIHHLETCTKYHPISHAHIFYIIHDSNLECYKNFKGLSIDMHAFTNMLSNTYIQMYTYWKHKVTHVLHVGECNKLCTHAHIYQQIVYTCTYNQQIVYTCTHISYMHSMHLYMYNCIYTYTYIDTQIFCIDVIGSLLLLLSGIITFSSPSITRIT